MDSRRGTVSAVESGQPRKRLPIIPLAQDEIHVWLTYYEEINDEETQEVYRNVLNGDEKKQEARFYFARDRRRYLVTRALVRTVLSRYAPVAPADWIFTNNYYGRPEIANSEMNSAELSFNVSHTRSLIALAVTRGRALGVDVENVQAREVSIDIAERFFSPSEVAALAGTPANQQRDRFFEYWTFKESYIKARGMGLSLPLDKFSFRYPDDRAVEIAIHPELADHPRRWQFWQLRPRPEYLVAICAERVSAQSPTIVIRMAIPMVVETILDSAFCRTSA
jgi:4'-phosphopantetheinyl transferase